MNDVRAKPFKNLGYLIVDLTKDQLAPIQDEVNRIQADFNNPNNRPMNSRLAGNVEHEYVLVDSRMHIEHLVIQIAKTYDEAYNYFKDIDYCTTDTPLVMPEPWVNFQSKHDFNPPHFHSGVLSFVLWLKVPYKIEDEMKQTRSVYSNFNTPGHFIFSYTNVLGQIQQEKLPVDETWEGKLCMFPSSMVHSVMPFYTSDEYRISVAGNIKLYTG